MHFLGYCFLALFAFSSATAQRITIDNSGNRGIVQALELKETGDLLFAAEILSQLSTHSQDSVLIAESLYWLIQIGDAAAKRMNKRLLLSSPVIGESQESSRRSWNERKWELIKEDLDVLNSAGLNVVSSYFVESYYANDYSEAYKKLAELYGDTIWGEVAAAEYVWKSGEASFNHEEAIKTGLAFLERYPESEYLETVYAALGCAYSDQWELSEEDEARLQAIEYYKLAKEFKSEKIDLYQRDINDLKAKKLIYSYCFFAD